MMKQNGFSLVELLVVVAIVGIISAIAVPAYGDYVRRAKIPEATSYLATRRVQMEQYYQDNRTYVGEPVCAATVTAVSQNFDFSCPAASLTATGYLLVATGKSSMSGFVYNVDQSNARTTTIASPAPASWAVSGATCWVTKKGGEC